MGDGLNRKHEVFDFMRGIRTNKYLNSEEEEHVIN